MSVVSVVGSAAFAGLAVDTLVTLAGVTAPRVRLVATSVVVVAALAAVGVGLRAGPGRGTVLVAAAPVGLVYAYTTVVVPWTGVSLAVAQLSLEATLAAPGGGTLTSVLFGGFTLSAATLERVAAAHRALLAAG